MATTATERKLLIGGEWVETGEWIEVASPYDGSVVGRVPEAGAEETRRALDAAERAMREPLPAHERAAILDRVAAALAERHDDVARTISAEAGKPMKAARVEASRAVSTYTMAAVEARKLAGDVVPMDASPAGVGQARLHAAAPDRRRRGDLAVQLPAEPRRAQDRAGARRRVRGRAQARLADAALGAPARRARDRGGPSRRLAERRLRAARARSATCSSRTSACKLITFTGSVAVGWKLRERAPRKRVNLELGNATPVIVAADADLDDAAARLAANAFSFAGQSCISVQRIYVERSAYDALPRALPAARRGARGRRSRRRGDGRRAR